MTMDSTQIDVLRLIETFVNEVRTAKNLGPIAIRPETSLVDGSTGIDSLDLAAMVVELHTRTEKDPFADGFRNFDNARSLAELFS